MTITFIGHGYVGLVTAAVFADLGNTVYVLGHTPAKIERLKKGDVLIYEPGLEEVVKRNIEAGRIHFTLEYKEATSSSEVIFIAVGTPSKENGEADLSTVFAVAKNLAPHLQDYTVVATKSTVPMGTNRKIKEIIEQGISQKASFDVASVPEFLREGSALSDTLHPDRVIIGTESQKAQDVLLELHKPLDAAFVLTNIESAEMIKYAANAFLSTKISFANAIAKLCELTGADAPSVLDGVGLDARIGRAFLYPGVGFGGSCFPKDVKALLAIARNHDYHFDLLQAVDKINHEARTDFVRKAKNLLGNQVLGKTVGVLGLSFKPNTDDMRDAPSVDIIKALKKEGAHIKAYDPVAMENAEKILGKEATFCKDPYTVCENVDILVIVTDWNEFKELDLIKVKKLMKGSIILDGRNIYDPAKVKALGFTYQGVGR